MNQTRGHLVQRLVHEACLYIKNREISKAEMCFPGENSVQGQGIKNPGYAFGNEDSGTSTGLED